MSDIFDFCRAMTLGFAKGEARPRANTVRPYTQKEVDHSTSFFIWFANYLLASSIATATATVIPTMGLLPAPDMSAITRPI